MRRVVLLGFVLLLTTAAAAPQDPPPPRYRNAGALGVAAVRAFVDVKCLV
jgi:hypothetical protein